jgi:hypothetical protein
MFDIRLFLGFEVDDTFEASLSEVNPHLIKCFFNDKTGEYLCEINHQNKRFIGKHLDTLIEVKQLSLLENNIQSIISKVVPQYDQSSLKIIAVQNNDK